MAIDAGSIQASIILDVSSFGQGIANAKTQLQSFSDTAKSVDDTLKQLQQSINNSYSAISQAASQAAKTMADDNVKAAGQMKTAFAEMASQTEQLLSTFQNNVVKIMQGAAGQMQSAGANMGDGLVSGIMSRLSAASNAGAALARAAEQGAKAAAQIHSPSRVFMEIGRYLDEGLAEGIKQNEYMATDEMTKIANALLHTGNEISTGLITIDKTTGSILIDNAYEALMTKTELYLTERDQRVMQITEGTEESIRQIERETQATEDAYDIKIKLYEQEMYAKLALIDDASSGEISGLKKQLDDINRLNDEDRKKEAALRYEEQLSEKEKALAKADSAEEVERILSQIEVLKRNRQKTLLQEQRKEEQDAIREQIQEIQEKAKKDKDALRDEFESKKYQLQQMQEAELAYMKEVQQKLSEDAKMRKELEQVQTKLKEAEEKKRSQTEVAELKAREKELLLSLGNNKAALSAFTAEVETIGKSYGEKLISGFRSTEDEIVEYLSWIANQAEKAGKAVAEAKEGKTGAARILMQATAEFEADSPVAMSAFGTMGLETARANMLRSFQTTNLHTASTIGVYQVEQKQKNSQLFIDYEKLAEVLSKTMRPQVNMENHFSSHPLTEAEIRKNQEILLRDLAFRL